MTTNIWREFAGILPGEALQVVEVITHQADGRTSIVEFPNASQVIVRGQGVAEGGFAFIRGGEIVGEAPAITPVTLDV